MKQGCDIASLQSSSHLDPVSFGARATRLSAMHSLGVRIPRGIVLSTYLVDKIAENGVDGVQAEIRSALDELGPIARFSVRGSTEVPGWGAPVAVTDVCGRDELYDVLVSMAQAWMRPTAVILRNANGAPEDAGLALIVHEMIEGSIERYQSVDDTSGEAINTGASKEIETWSKHATTVLSDACAVEYISAGGELTLIGIFPAKRKSRAEIQIVVDLVASGVLSKEDALLRIDPRNLTEQLHPQIDVGGNIQVIARGIGGSPGAAQGAIVFSPEAAQAAHSQGQQVILVRNETTPEDIRGMHSAAGVLTFSGGTSSHAAVIAQGIGVPCVVGASSLKANPDLKVLTLSDGSTLNEGDFITLDGSEGTVMLGALPLVHSPLSDAFSTLMGWADETREMGVRANADTLREAQTAKRFLVDGIGLCRTENMFFAEDRINVMREMILVEDLEHRQAALDRLLPMQRQNFVELFEIMEGAPVTIRLLDPPLHEFLPKGADEVATLAASMDLPVDVVRTRIGDLEEYNPMLGKRGVRLAVTMPEIYEMQARAIFEAALIVSKSSGVDIVPEIMIPLVSAYKEVELVKSRIDAVAARVKAESGEVPEFHVGVMVETPRAALRAGDLAQTTSFLSFGTNDLTQMTYGLSRDDAGRFMREYVNRGVYPEDPFLTLDLEGVGELLLTASGRGREANRDIELGLCGEHGGDPASVRFCKLAGFDYVSCSPFRVPIARLAAAQATLLSRQDDK